MSLSLDHRFPGTASRYRIRVAMCQLPVCPLQDERYSSRVGPRASPPRLQRLSPRTARFRVCTRAPRLRISRSSRIPRPGHRDSWTQPAGRPLRSGSDRAQVGHKGSQGWCLHGRLNSSKKRLGSPLAISSSALWLSSIARSKSSAVAMHYLLADIGPLEPNLRKDLRQRGGGRTSGFRAKEQWVRPGAAVSGRDVAQSLACAGKERVLRAGLVHQSLGLR